MQKLRYTGPCLPPPEVLAEFPNWVFAVDEEDVEGQDETTIRPESQQLYISAETEFTAADVTLASGAVHPTIITMEDKKPQAEERKPQALDVWNGNGWWGMVNCGESWRVSEDWGARSDDPKVFPLRVDARLKWSNGSRLSFTIHSDGSMKESSN